MAAGCGGISEYLAKLNAALKQEHIDENKLRGKVGWKPEDDCGFLVKVTKRFSCDGCRYRARSPQGTGSQSCAVVGKSRSAGWRGETRFQTQWPLWNGDSVVRDLTQTYEQATMAGALAKAGGSRDEFC